MTVISEEEKILSGFRPRIRPQIYARGVFMGLSERLSLSAACTYVDKCIFYATTNLFWTSR